MEEIDDSKMSLSELFVVLLYGKTSDQVSVNDTGSNCSHRNHAA